jgi:hypothetical protein
MLMCSGSALALAASAKDGHTAASPDRTLTSFAAECFAAAAMLSFASIALTLVRMVLVKGIWRAEIVPAVVKRRRPGAAAAESKARESGGGVNDPLLQDPFAARELVELAADCEAAAAIDVEQPASPPTPPPPPQSLVAITGDELDALLGDVDDDDDGSGSNGAPAAADDVSAEAANLSAWAYDQAAALRIQRTREGQRLFDELHTMLNDGSSHTAVSQQQQQNQHPHQFPPQPTDDDLDLL